VRERERRKQIVQVVVVRGKSFRFSRDKMVDGQQWESVNFGHEGAASRVSSKCFIVVVGSSGAVMRSWKFAFALQGHLL
jgi:hypothetical protein